MDPRSSAVNRVLLLAIVATGAALRFYRLGEASVWLDEVVSINATQRLTEPLTFYTHPPLPYAAFALWTALFGDSDAAWRSLSALSGTLTILVTYLVARRAFESERVALAGAAFVAVLPFGLWHSREIRNYSIWPLFVALSWWGLFGLRDRHTSRHAAGWYVAGTLLAALSHYYTVFYAAAGALAAFFVIGDHPLRKSRADVRRWLTLHLPVIVAGGAFVLFRYVMWGKTGLTHAQGRWRPLTTSLNQLSKLVFYRDWTSEDVPRIASRLGIALLVMLLLAFVVMLRDRRVRTGTALGLATLLWAPFIAIELMPVRGYSRLLAPTVPLLAIWLGYFLFAPLGERRGGLLWRAADVARMLLLVAFGATLTSYVGAVYGPGVEPWKEVCASIAAEATKDDLVLVNEPYMIMPFRRCYDAPAPLVRFPRMDPPLNLGNLKDFAAPNPAIWFVYSHAWETDPRRQGVSSLGKTHEVASLKRYGRVIDVYHLRRRAEPRG